MTRKDKKIKILILFETQTLSRFNAVVLRNRFDETRKIKDGRVLAKMLEDGKVS